MFIHKRSWVSPAAEESASGIVEFPSPCFLLAISSRGKPLPLWLRLGYPSSEALEKGLESWLRRTERLHLCAGVEGYSFPSSRPPVSHPDPAAVWGEDVW